MPDPCLFTRTYVESATTCAFVRMSLSCTMKPASTQQCMDIRAVRQKHCFECVVTITCGQLDPKPFVPEACSIKTQLTKHRRSNLIWPLAYSPAGFTCRYKRISKNLLRLQVHTYKGCGCKPETRAGEVTDQTCSNVQHMYLSILLNVCFTW